MARLPSLLWLGLTILLTTKAAFGQRWTPATYPDPSYDPVICRANDWTWVCDPDNVLANNELDELEHLLRDIGLALSPFPIFPHCGKNGLQTGVALMRDMGSSWDPSYFAARLISRWNLAGDFFDRRCNNGAILLIALRSGTDGKGRSVIKPAVQPSKQAMQSLQDILTVMQPAMGNGAYSTAIQLGVALLGATYPLELFSSAGNGTHANVSTSAAAANVTAHAAAAQITFMPPTQLAPSSIGTRTTSSSFAPSLHQSDNNISAGNMSSTASLFHVQQLSDIFDAAGPGMMAAFILVPAAFIVLFIFIACMAMRQEREFDLHLNKLISEQIRAHETGRNPRATCPICLESFHCASARAISHSSTEKQHGHASPGPTGAHVREPLLRQHAHPSAAKANAGQRTPSSKPCGHTFCQPCINKWDSGVCPICAGGAGDDDTVNNNCQSMSYDSEMLFRLHSLSSLHPSHLPTPVVSDILSCVSEGQLLTWAMVKRHIDDYKHQLQQSQRNNSHSDRNAAVATWDNSNTHAHARHDNSSRDPAAGAATASFSSGDEHRQTDCGHEPRGHSHDRHHRQGDHAHHEAAARGSHPQHHHQAADHHARRNPSIGATLGTLVDTFLSGGNNDRAEAAASGTFETPDAGGRRGKSHPRGEHTHDRGHADRQISNAR